MNPAARRGPSILDRRPIVLVSNRGPIAFDLDDAGNVVTAKTGGGLAAGVRPVLAQTGGMWVCVPLTEADRQSVGTTASVDGIQVVFADVDADVADAGVGRVANEYLWFMHHGLTEIAREPTPSDWLAFERYNRAVAECVAAYAPPRAAVLVQDYHLPFVASHLKASRPDLVCTHFNHIPFASPEVWRRLPPAERARIAEGFGDYAACGFHSTRWAERFAASVGIDVTPTPATFVTQLAPDLEAMRRRASSDRCVEEGSRLAAHHGGRKLIVRVDRLEPTKNHLVAVEAFEDLLSRRSDMRDKVTLIAYAYPSRSALGAYRVLRQMLTVAVDRVNDRFGTTDWTPIELDLNDDLDAAVAGLRTFDVLLVNPVEDGLNLVAFEGAALNEASGTIVLSTNCGAHDALAGTVHSIDPTDLGQTSEALERALEMPSSERVALATKARMAALGLSSQRWLEDQLAASVLQERDDLGR